MRAPGKKAVQLRRLRPATSFGHENRSRAVISARCSRFDRLEPHVPHSAPPSRYGLAFAGGGTGGRWVLAPAACGRMGGGAGEDGASDFVASDDLVASGDL